MCVSYIYKKEMKSSENRSSKMHPLQNINTYMNIHEYYRLLNKMYLVVPSHCH